MSTLPEILKEGLDMPSDPQEQPWQASVIGTNSLYAWEVKHRMHRQRRILKKQAHYMQSLTAFSSHCQFLLCGGEFHVQRYARHPHRRRTSPAQNAEATWPSPHYSKHGRATMSWTWGAAYGMNRMCSRKNTASTPRLEGRQRTINRDVRLPFYKQSMITFSMITLTCSLLLMTLRFCTEFMSIS